MNSRLDALQAAILRVKLRYFDEWTKARQENAARCLQLFESHGLDRILTLRVIQPGCTHIYNQYVIRAPQRYQLKEALHSCGVPTDTYYPIPLHLQRAFAHLEYKPGDLPESEAPSREVLALPILPEMSAGQQNLVVGSIAMFYSAGAPGVAP
jgi:dTDP-4-amino-4,6-dideoxygalactose transaminase